jgi:hypothetical protein
LNLEKKAITDMQLSESRQIDFAKLELIEYGRDSSRLKRNRAIFL